jgi:hypothetical protein
MVWSKGERSKRLKVFGADSDEEGGIISTDTECFERVGGGERVDVEEEAMEGDVGWTRTKAAEVEGTSEFIRGETVWSGLETAEASFEDTVATVAMWRSCVYA